MLVGVVDKICGNRWGYGNKFDEGMNTLGPLALAMVGIIAAVPIIAKYIEPLISSVYAYVGASPAMFGGTLLACDMGGYALSMQMAGSDQAIGNFAGLITGSMMGVTFVFTIPVALSIIDKRYYSYISLGVLIGLLTIPLGCIAGGMAMSLWGYSLDFLQIIQNLIPLIILDAVIVLGLLCWPVKTLRVFVVFGSFITKMIVALLGIAVAQHLTGIRLPVFSMMVQVDPSTGISPLIDGFITVGNIAMVLLGAFPMVHFITTKFSKLIIRIGKKSGLNENDCTGMIASLANSIPMMQLFSTMSGKGRLINMAFAISASFVLGDHLGFTAGVNSQMITPVIIGKLVAGVSALGLALLLYNRTSRYLTEEVDSVSPCVDKESGNTTAIKN